MLSEYQARREAAVHCPRIFGSSTLGGPSSGAPAHPLKQKHEPQCLHSVGASSEGCEGASCSRHLFQDEGMPPNLSTRDSYFARVLACPRRACPRLPWQGERARGGGKGVVIKSGPSLLDFSRSQNRPLLLTTVAHKKWS